MPRETVTTNTMEQRYLLKQSGMQPTLALFLEKSQRIFLRHSKNALQKAGNEE